MGGSGKDSLHLKREENIVSVSGGFLSVVLGMWWQLLLNHELA